MKTVTPQPTDNVDADAIKKKNKQKVTWGIVCLLGPLTLLLLTLLYFGVVNLVFPSGEASALKSILNTIGFIVGGVAVITLLPGFIAGLVLIAARRPVPPYVDHTS